MKGILRTILDDHRKAAVYSAALDTIIVLLENDNAIVPAPDDDRLLFIYNSIVALKLKARELSFKTSNRSDETYHP